MQALPTLGCCQGFKLALCRFANCSGRARRSEYWWFKFNYGLILFFAIFPCFFIKNEETLKRTLFIVESSIGIFFFLPNLCVTIRRLHDTGRSGCFLFLLLIPLVGYIIILYFTICDSQELTNEYGPSPKYIQPKANFLENSNYYNLNDLSH